MTECDRGQSSIINDIVKSVEDTTRQESNPKPNEKFGTAVKRKIAAGAAAFAIATGVGSLAGCDQIPTAITEVQPSETKPSVTTSESGTSVKVDPVGTTEAPTATPTTVETTTAPTETTVNTGTNFNRENLNQILIERYADELKECKPELRLFCSQMLNLQGVSSGDKDVTFSQIGEKLTREEIVDYGKTGEDSRVIEDEDGTPRLWMIGWTEKSQENIREAMKTLQGWDPKALTILNENGTFAFMLAQSDMHDEHAFGYSKEGLTIYNASQEYADTLPVLAFCDSLITENIGTAMLNLGGKYSEIVGFIKEEIAGDEFLNLYNKIGKKDFLEISKGCYLYGGEVHYNNEYGKKITDADVQEIIKKVYDHKLISFFGGTGEEIDSTAMYHSVLG